MTLLQPPTPRYDYVRDGQEIYRRSFATIRAELDLSSVPTDLHGVATRVAHAAGDTGILPDLAGFETCRDTTDAIAEKIAAAVLPQEEAAITNVYRELGRLMGIQDIPEILDRLETVGLHTKGACGDTVRAVIASPLAGLDAREKIDVRPLAAAAGRATVAQPKGSRACGGLASTSVIGTRPASISEALSP